MHLHALTFTFCGELRAMPVNGDMHMCQSVTVLVVGCDAAYTLQRLASVRVPLANVPNFLTLKPPHFRVYYLAAAAF
jgi:hypothetical protein